MIQGCLASAFGCCVDPEFFPVSEIEKNDHDTQATVLFSQPLADVAQTPFGSRVCDLRFLGVNIRGGNFDNDLVVENGRMRDTRMVNPG